MLFCRLVLWLYRYGQAVGADVVGTLDFLSTFVNKTTMNTTLNVLFTPRGKTRAHSGVTRTLHGENVGLGHGRVSSLMSRVTRRVGSMRRMWGGVWRG